MNAGAADFLAYEGFKLLNDAGKSNEKMRLWLRKLLGKKTPMQITRFTDENFKDLRKMIDNIKEGRTLDEGVTSKLEASVEALQPVGLRVVRGTPLICKTALCPKPPPSALRSSVITSFITPCMDFPRMPAPGDKMFKQSARLPLRRDLEGSWVAYAEGYKLAADSLVSLQLQSTSSTNAYPAVFLYRHFIELEFKSIFALLYILQTVREGDTNSMERVRAMLATHDLVALCEGCHQIANQLYLQFEGYSERFPSVAACVKETCGARSRVVCLSIPHR